jgi:hypothetical protein
MPPRLRKLALTFHVAVSVGWIGAVAAFLALALTRDAYPAMAAITQYVIVPLAVASLLTGLVQAVGTPWGLLRHYWVVVKLAFTAVATLVLLVQVGPITAVAHGSGGQAARLSLALHACGGLLVLVTSLVLSVFKPRGRLTRAPAREQAAPAPLPPP